MFKRKVLSVLSLRREGIRQWLSDMAPYTAVDQKHLNAGSPEQAYWHHGYQAALADILDMSVTTSGKPRNADM